MVTRFSRIRDFAPRIFSTSQSLASTCSVTDGMRNVLIPFARAAKGMTWSARCLSTVAPEPRSVTRFRAVCFSYELGSPSPCACHVCPDQASCVGFSPHSQGCSRLNRDPFKGRPLSFIIENVYFRMKPPPLQCLFTFSPHSFGHVSLLEVRGEGDSSYRIHLPLADQVQRLQSILHRHDLHLNPAAAFRHIAGLKNSHLHVNAHLSHGGKQNMLEVKQGRCKVLKQAACHSVG